MIIKKLPLLICKKFSILFQESTVFNLEECEQSELFFEGIKCFFTAYILNQGKVAHAICASTAIPGVMKPVEYGDRLLLDGAVAQPVPVALAKSMGADIVIAVDVSTPLAIKKEPKNFVATILNTIDIMSERIIQDELQLANFVLTPWLEVNQHTFKESASYIEKGEEVAHEIIPEIKKRIALMMSH